MALIHICRSVARSGRPRFVPGGASCAASGRRASFVPTAFPLSSALKLSGVMVSPLNRLKSIPV